VVCAQMASVRVASLVALTVLLCAYTASASPVGAAKVKVGAFIEGLCPDCRNYITYQLYPAWTNDELQPIMTLDLVPYGNAREKQIPNGWAFTCQHGPDECYVNVVETCAISQYPNISQHFSFINCLETVNSLSGTGFGDDPISRIQPCALDNNIDYDNLINCANGTTGNNLEHAMAQKTDKLSPSHQYVPWITINGIHSTDAENDIISAVCAAYTGTKPPACQSPRIAKLGPSYSCKNEFVN